MLSNKVWMMAVLPIKNCDSSIMWLGNWLIDKSLLARVLGHITCVLVVQIYFICKDHLKGNNMILSIMMGYKGIKVYK